MISDFKEKETLTTTTNKLDTDWLEMNHFAASPISERKITKEFGNPARDKVRQPPWVASQFQLNGGNGNQICYDFETHEWKESLSFVLNTLQNVLIL